MSDYIRQLLGMRGAPMPNSSWGPSSLPHVSPSDGYEADVPYDPSVYEDTPKITVEGVPAIPGAERDMPPGWKRQGRGLFDDAPPPPPVIITPPPQQGLFHSLPLPSDRNVRRRPAGGTTDT